MIWRTTLHCIFFNGEHWRTGPQANVASLTHSCILRLLLLFWMGWGSSHNVVKGNAALRCNTSLVQHQAKAGSLYPPFTHSRISKLLLDGGSCNCNWIVEHCRTAKDQSCIISHSFAHLMTTPRSYCCYYWGVFTQCNEVECTLSTLWGWLGGLHIRVQLWFLWSLFSITVLLLKRDVLSLADWLSTVASMAAWWNTKLPEKPETSMTKFFLKGFQNS